MGPLITLRLPCVNFPVSLPTACPFICSLAGAPVFCALDCACCVPSLTFFPLPVSPPPCPMVLPVLSPSPCRPSCRRNSLPMASHPPCHTPPGPVLFFLSPGAHYAPPHGCGPAPQSPTTGQFPGSDIAVAAADDASGIADSTSADAPDVITIVDTEGSGEQALSVPLEGGKGEGEGEGESEGENEGEAEEGEGKRVDKGEGEGGGEGDGMESVEMTPHASGVVSPVAEGVTEPLFGVAEVGYLVFAAACVSRGDDGFACVPNSLLTPSPPLALPLLQRIGSLLQRIGSPSATYWISRVVLSIVPRLTPHPYIFHPLPRAAV